ncbi:MmcQ/YjbR family DNA-binding protein [Pedobacter paludis]|uniref:MmcQ/YjbR family DNA-binding protein n=1 Tax=Pedobacter paludis TaxID=2203212 RepID=A0A317F6J6_9SPHI|nr:MmcQ/YjbR family DNA-binding protein [Pedobacter paludis]PWS33148.1 hypothetical protein DF947_00485 [Pedobacter paludis]
MELPAVNEKIRHGTPAFYVNKKLFARLKEDGENLVLYTENRTFWMKRNPIIYFITPHYENYKYMLVSLKLVDPQELKDLLTEAWKYRAPKTLTKQTK